MFVLFHCSRIQSCGIFNGNVFFSVETIARNVSFFSGEEPLFLMVILRVEKAASRKMVKYTDGYGGVHY